MMLRRTELRRTQRLRRAAILHRHTYTGPSVRTRRVVRARAQDGCEWPLCGRVGTDYHHRLNRKQGGRHGHRRVEVNRPSWIVLVCRLHHDLVTSASGPALVHARQTGWVLTEDQCASSVPIEAVHGRCWLTDDGTVAYEEPT